MDFGAHLPLIDFGGTPQSLRDLAKYADAARDLGYVAITANDHLAYPRPWLDGATALASVLAQSGDMRLMTTVTLPVVRGPVATAKTLAALDVLSEGRVTAGVGPGSSARDYEAAGIPFEERWKRLDDVVPALRALWRGESYRGVFYSTEGIELLPHPAQAGGPPIWIGSWGSEAGLRRTARLADGWLASAYNTTPEEFANARARLDEHLRSQGKEAQAFPNALATMWIYVTDDRAAAGRVVRDVLVPMLRRDESEVRERLLVGPAEECAAKVRAYRDAGVQRLLVWPVGDELLQLAVFRALVDEGLR
jgi:alkanesulfonate monooxygenase SsuD/methylene tetrahydromethanopterin reductase-like flavin-dependent oxidoreductase (luciferase family)